MMTTRPPRRSDAAVGAPVTPPPLHSVAAVVPLDPGFYAFRLAGHPGWHGVAAGIALPAVQVCAAPCDGAAIEIADSFGRTGSWLGGGHPMLFVTAPAAGGVALVTAYLDRDPASPPLEVEIRRVDAPGGAAATGRVVRFGAAEPPDTPPSPASIGLEIIAHIRGRGAVLFADAAWVGRVQPGLWIEALTILPRDPAAAAAIEYKGLNASGAETPWLDTGSVCGLPGGGIPLIGFAVRQKAAASETLFDCDYIGYFASGTTTGPAHNGAPCRSAAQNDPLEGLQLRIAPRAAPTAASKAG